jgi:hypothetical protein
MVSHSGKNVARRDGKLLLALTLFLVAGAACFAQAWIVKLYIWSVDGRDWSVFLRLFPSYATETPPDRYYDCLGTCHPDLPFFPGWVGIVSFCSGLAVLAYAWRKSKSTIESAFT